MDSIFIFFVIYMLFSLIARIFRAAADQKRKASQTQAALPARRPGQGGYPDREEGRRLHDEPEAFSWQEFLFPDDSDVPAETVIEPQEADEGVRQVAAQKTPAALKSVFDESGIMLHRSREMPRKAIRPGQSIKHAAAMPDLERMLKRGNIHQAIIAATVLGAPRAKIPLPPGVRQSRHGN